MINRPGVHLTACAAVIAFTSASAMAGGHTWRVNELFSTADGTIQFIELKECCGMNAEIAVGGHDVSSNANSYFFPGNLACCVAYPNCCTAGKNVLLATAGFAALIGAPTPDNIIPAGFFSVAGDTITYWVYSTQTFLAGALPTDGINSLNYPGATTAANSPTNYAGATASLNVPCLLADMSYSGAVDVPDLLTLLAAWGMAAAGPPDLNGNGFVDVPDLLILLANWGPC